MTKRTCLSFSLLCGLARRHENSPGRDGSPRKVADAADVFPVGDLEPGLVGVIIDLHLRKERGGRLRPRFRHSRQQVRDGSLWNRLERCIKRSGFASGSFQG